MAHCRHIAKALSKIKADINEFAHEAGRDPGAIRLIAVSKNVAVDQLIEAYRNGQYDFGENRIQEMKTKVEAVPQTIRASVRWHMLGHLQRNKVKIAVRLSHLIHSVDAVSLLRAIDTAAAEMGKRQAILLQVNVSGELQKYGFAIDEVPTAFKHCRTLKSIHCQGLMTIAPLHASTQELRKIFSRLYRLRQELEDDFSIRLAALSMGMSNDYKSAITEGSTMLRIGRALFQIPRTHLENKQENT